MASIIQLTFYYSHMFLTYNVKAFYNAFHDNKLFILEKSVNFYLWIEKIPDSLRPGKRYSECRKNQKLPGRIDHQKTKRWNSIIKQGKWADAGQSEI